MKKLIIGLMAFLYVGVASAETDFRILDTFPWPRAVRCAIADSSLTGGWELENGNFIYVQEFENINGDKILTVEKYNTSLERVGYGWGGYAGASSAEVNMYHLEGDTFTTHYKMAFGFYSDALNNGRTCNVKTPYVLSINADDESRSTLEYNKLSRFEDLALILR